MVKDYYCLDAIGSLGVLLVLFCGSWHVLLGLVCASWDFLGHLGALLKSLDLSWGSLGALLGPLGRMLGKISA